MSFTTTAAIQGMRHAVVRGVRVLFQPVVDLGGPTSHVVAHESLVRGRQDTVLDCPEVFAACTRALRAQRLLEHAQLTSILEASRLLPEGIDLTMNVHASALADETFAGDLLAALHLVGRAPADLVLAIREDTPAFDRVRFRETRERLRSHGIRVTLDDFGRGHANYATALECRPDFLKIAGYLVRGCAEDSARQAVVASIVALARGIGAQVIADGIENEDDLRTVRAAGVRLVQGSFLQRRGWERAGSVPPRVARFATAARMQVGA